MRRQREKETRRQGGKETRRQGGKDRRSQGDKILMIGRYTDRRRIGDEEMRGSG